MHLFNILLLTATLDCFQLQFYEGSLWSASQAQICEHAIKKEGNHNYLYVCDKNVHHGILASYDETCETMHFLSGILYDSTNMLYMPDNCQQAEKCGPILSSILQKLKALCKC